MKKSFGVAVISVLLLVFLVYRSRQVQPVVISGPQGAPGAAMDGLRLVAKVDRRQFEIGEPVKIVAKILNVSSQDIRVNESKNHNDDLEITVRDDKGNTVPFTLYGKTSYKNGMNNLNSGGPGPFVIHRDQSRDYEVSLSSIYDLTEAMSYHITLKRRIESRKIIVSQPVVVDVLWKSAIKALH